MHSAITQQHRDAREIQQRQKDMEAARLHHLYEACKALVPFCRSHQPAYDSVFLLRARTMVTEYGTV